MYENYTYEYILKTILDRISATDPTIDTREGSAMWYAVAPVAVELAIAYSNCDMLRKESFVGTATRTGMYLACDDIGIDTAQFEATAGEFLAHFNVEVSLGSRWGCGDYIFSVKSKVGTVVENGTEFHQYLLVCETTGSQTQYTRGILRPITDYGSNHLQVAVLDECVTAGLEERSDAEVRATYFDYITNKSDGANIAQYNQWLNEFESNGKRIGAYKVIPTWNGANTVKTIILDSNKRAPTTDFVTSVQNYLDPNKEGLGEGKAPIGAVVTVEPGVDVFIDVEAKITLATENADTTDVVTLIEDYFREIAFHKTTVSIYEVASKILASPAVSGVNDVKMGKYINGQTTVMSTDSIELGNIETPVLRVVNFV